MGLDIYAGSLTRYYLRDWDTITQQLSEEAGYKCVTLDGNGNEIKPKTDEEEVKEIREAVCEWRDHIAAGIDPSLPAPFWDENERSAYFTDNPGWEAFGALMLLHACSLSDSPFPEYVDSSWGAYEEPVVKNAMQQKNVSSLLAEVSLWVPIPQNVLFIASLPTGEESTLSTVSMLRQELEELNRKMWQADEATILSWRNDKYYKPEIEVIRKESKSFFGLIRKTKEIKIEKYRTEDLAQCAFSIMYQAVKFADEHKVPLILDY